jgi:transposase
MAKRQFKLTEAQDNELKWAYNQCHDAQTKIRYQAVRLYGKGYPIIVIQEITGCSRPSLMEWCRAYRQWGVAGLVDQRRGGNRAKLTSTQLEQLQQQLETYTPRQLLGQTECHGDGQFWTVAHLAKVVQQKYGITYKSATSYRSLFDRCEFSPQRPVGQYRSRNEQQVLEFEQELEKNW